MYEILESYINACAFIGILLVTSTFLYAIVFIMTEAWKECFKPELKKVLGKLAIVLYKLSK